MTTRAKRYRSSHRETWHWPWRRRQQVRERFCPECNRPYVEAPEPQPVEQFVAGSATSLVYTVRNWGRKGFLTRMGRWQPSQSGLWLSQFFIPEDFDDLAKVTADARMFIDARARKGWRR